MCLRSCFFYFLLNKQWTMFQKPTFIFLPSMKEDHSDKVVGGRYTRDMHHLIDHCRIFWPSHNKEYILQVPTYLGKYQARTQKKKKSQKFHDEKYIRLVLTKKKTRLKRLFLISPQKNRDQTIYFLPSVKPEPDRLFLVQHQKKTGPDRQVISCLASEKITRSDRLFLVSC